MSTSQSPQPNSQGQTPISQQPAQQQQQNRALKYPYYAPQMHYAPGSLNPGATQQTQGPTAQFLQAGMQGRPSTPYQQQQSGQSTPSYQYPVYSQTAVRTGTPSNSTTPAPSASTSAIAAGTNTGTGTTTTTQGTSVTASQLPAHLQQYAHYFQNIHNLGTHFTGYSTGNYTYTPSTGTYGQTTAGSTATTGLNYNTVYPGVYGTTAGATSGYGTTGTRGHRDDDEDLLPGMDDADYSAQSQYQSQSKADLKVLLDAFTPEQHERFEAYRRSALNKNSVKKVVQTTTGQLVSASVSQVLAGVAKVFVGEIVEKARAIQERQGETGPLTPEHLRKAYHAYQEECGWVGPAKPLKGKKLFIR